MERGSYIAASSGLMQLRKLDVVSNNIANANTVGFKRELIVGEAQSFDETLAKTVANQDPFARGDHARTPGVVHVETKTDFTPGSIKATGNTLDVAIAKANDFFVINTASGPQYTRAGNFSLSSEGILVTQDGHAVQSDGGEITVSGPHATISPDGTVSAGGTPIGKLQVVRFKDPSGLERIGASRFAIGQASQPEQVEPELIPQSLEMSNVSAVSGIIDLITANRGFDLYTKSARTIDELNNTAISQVGRRR